MAGFMNSMKTLFGGLGGSDEATQQVVDELKEEVGGNETIIEKSNGDEEEEEDDGTPKQAKLEDSNIAGIGSQENRDLRKEAAASDKEFKGAGSKVGLEIWRVENRRTENDTPDFGVKRWPKEDYGSFYSGDSYIILNTYRPLDPLTRKPMDRLAWDVHFWLGSETTQDEMGVAAYKTVEIDDLLDDGPIQYRETQYHESKLFQSYFKELKYMKGGIASGFRHVEPEEYEPRLFMVRSSRKTTRAFEIPVAASNINNGDVFVLDTGRKVYKFVGESASFFERNKGGLLQSNIVNARNGKARKYDIDDEFWATLEGTEDDIRPADDPYLPGGMEKEEVHYDPSSLKVFRISDESGEMKFTLEAEGPKVPYQLLDPNDVFLVESNIGLWIWIGGSASKAEKSQSMKIADQYIKDNELGTTTPVSVLKQSNFTDNHLFMSMFSA